MKVDAGEGLEVEADEGLQVQPGEGLATYWGAIVCLWRSFWCHTAPSGLHVSTGRSLFGPLGVI